MGSGLRQLNMDQEFRADSHPAGVYFVKWQLNSVTGDLYSHNTHTHTHTHTRTRFKLDSSILAISSTGYLPHALHTSTVVDCVWNVMAHGDAREGKWRGNWRMEWVTIKRHATAEHRLVRAVKTLQADVHSSRASSRLNWCPCRFKWTRPFRRKTKSCFCACAITFQTQSTSLWDHWQWVVWNANKITF
jgi:hypothetical protein